MTLKVPHVGLPPVESFEAARAGIGLADVLLSIVVLQLLLAGKTFLTFETPYDFLWDAFLLGLST